MLEATSMSSLLETKIAARQHALREQGLLRQRKVLSVDHPLNTNASTSSPRFVFEGRAYVNFSSNDYLGLSRVPELAGGLAPWAQNHYGVGSGASPLVTGLQWRTFGAGAWTLRLNGTWSGIVILLGF